MVAGLLQLARPLVDPAAPHHRLQLVRHQNQVNAQSRIAPKAQRPVVPPAEQLRRLLEQPERIVQPQRQQPLQRLPLRSRHQNAIGPHCRIMHIRIRRRNVEIPGQNHPCIRLLPSQLRNPLLQRRNPAQLVDILLTVHRLPIREIRPDHPNRPRRRLEPRRHQPPLHILMERIVQLHPIRHIPRLLPIQQRHPVVRRLPGKDHPIPRRLDLVLRKLVIRQLRFLQTQEIHRIGHQPVQHMLQTHLQRIYIPCRQLHSGAP